MKFPAPLHALLCTLPFLCLEARAAGGSGRVFAPPSPYGVCSHLTYGEFPARGKTFALCGVAGIGTVRCDFNWESIENPAGTFDFSRTDAIVADAKAAGIDILPILDYGHPAYPKPHEETGPWRRFVRAVAGRYAADCPVFEVWNEPDHPSHKDTVNPTNYFAILESACEEIRLAAPSSHVAIAGLCGVPRKFIEELYRLGGGDYFDIMNIHAYSVPDEPEGKLDRMLEELRALMAKYGDADKPVWITEIGWPTNEQVPEGDPRREKWAYGTGVDESTAACRLSRELGIAFAEGVGMFMPYELRAREFARYSREAHFGIVRNNFVPKPPFTAYTAFTAMRPAGSVQKADVHWHDESRTFFFPQWRRPDNADAQREGKPLGADAGMIWTTGADALRTFRFTSTGIRFFNHLGAEIWPEQNDLGGYDVIVSEEPVYFVGGELAAPETVVAAAKAAALELDPTLVAIIADTHVNGLPAERLPEWCAGFSHQAGLLRKTVEEILALRPLPANVIGLGDYAFLWGMPEDYALVGGILAPLERAGIRVTLAMGDHDRRDNFLAQWPRYAEESQVSGRIVTRVDTPHCLFLMLDTVNDDPIGFGEKTRPGDLGDAQRKWLEAELKAAGKPIIACGHHGPRENDVDLAGLLLASPACKAYFHGHWHRWLPSFERLPGKGLLPRYTFPSTGHWGDIGFALLRTYPDRAVLELRQHDLLGEGVQNDALRDAVLKDRSGQLATIPFR